MTRPLKLRPLLRTLKIKDKDNLVSPFDLDRVPIDEHGCEADFAWAQREFVSEVERQYNARKPVRLIVLKARQLGISTLTEGILFLWNFHRPGSAQLVIAHQTKSTRSLFEKTKLYWRTWPLASEYSLISDTQHRFAWTNLSTMEVATAKTIESARGMTLSGVHGSEVAFWDEPEDLMMGLYPAVPRRHGTIMVLESTANGRGDFFHQTWEAASVGKSEFAPLFFPWWKHFEYTAKHIGIDPEIDTSLDEDEKLLRDVFGLSDDRLAWRRFIIDSEYNGDDDRFRQEYPACVTGETRVGTDLGIMPISEVMAWSPQSGTYGPFIRSIQQPPSSIYRLRTKLGYSFRGTFDHPVLTPAGVCIPLTALHPGMKVALAAPRFAEREAHEVWWEHGVESHLRITPEWGRLLGLFMGDGSYSNETLSIACDAKDLDVAEECQRLYKECLGLEGHLRKVGDRKGGLEVRAQSKEVKRLFDRLGLLRRSHTHVKRKVHVPEVIWRSSKPVVREFLRGLFEADGFNGYNLWRVVLFSKYPGFLHDIQLLLLGFGITSKFNSIEKKAANGSTYEGYELCLRSEEARAFNERIGWISQRKGDRHGNPQTKIGRRRLPLVLADEVLEVVDEGAEEPTWDLTILGGEKFDANGILTHNTPDEAFLHTGNAIFSEAKLKDCYAPLEGERGYFHRTGDHVDWNPDATGPWTLFFHPSEDREYGQYFVGADPTHSTGKDLACIQVINRRSLEQVAVYHGYDEPIRLGQEVLTVAQYYNDAYVSSEAEGPGYACIATILNSNYPNVWRWRRYDKLPGSNLANAYGWSNNWKSKELAVSYMRYLINKGLYGPIGRRMGEDGRWHAGIHDEETFAQLCNFTIKDNWVNGSMYGNADPKGYDDAVDALCIAHICSYSDGPMDFYDTRVSGTGPDVHPDVQYPIVEGDR